MIRRAITDLKDKKGSSRAAILKYILQHFKVGGNIIAVNAHIRQVSIFGKAFIRFLGIETRSH
jgi:hypothetical protein